SDACPAALQAIVAPLPGQRKPAWRQRAPHRWLAPLPTKLAGAQLCNKSPSRVEAIATQLLLQAEAREAEQPRRLRLVAVRAVHRFAYGRALEPLNALFERQIVGRLDGRFRLAGGHLRRQVVDADGVAAERGGAHDFVLQLAHVAGPAVADEL